MTTANIRAARELCGLTQQQVADALGVNVRTVKRWERGEVSLPDDARRYLRRMLDEHDLEVQLMVDDILGRGIEREVELYLEYYRTQEQSDLHTEAHRPYQFENAVTRAAAERLGQLGYSVQFSYPDEERIYTD